MTSRSIKHWGLLDRGVVLTAWARERAHQLASLGARALTRIAAATEAHALSGLILFTAAYAAATIARSLSKPLWFDELFSFYVSRLSTMQERLPAAVYDGHPPLFYGVTHAAMRLFGESALAERLPEMAGFWLLCVCLFVFTRRRCGAVYAFLALVLPLQTLAYHYAYEGRPYGIVLGMAGLSLLAWQSAGEGRRRPAWLATLAGSVAIAVSSHFYGIQIVLPLLVGEAFRTLERRKVDRGVAVAMGLGVLPLASLAPVARAAIKAQFTLTKALPHFDGRPSLSRLPGFYEVLLQPLVVPFALAFIVLVAGKLLWPKDVKDAVSAEPARRRVPLAESAALVSYLFLPPLMLLGTALTTGYFADRYAISAVIGVAVLFPMLLERAGGKRALAPIALIAGIVLVWGEQSLIPPPLAEGPRLAFYADSPLYPNNDDLPIVIAHPVAFLPSAHYASAPVAARLTYLTDLPYALRLPRFTAEVSLAGDRQLLPGTIADYGPFVLKHPKFWLYVTSHPESEWLPGRLIAEGWKLECRGRSGQRYLFLATHE